MRSMQFGGKPILISPNRIYNCAYMPVESIDAFSEAMVLLLGGSGVGYSVQKHHVDQLPPVRIINKHKRYVVGDNKEGWAYAIKELMKGYFGLSKTIPRFEVGNWPNAGKVLGSTRSSVSPISSTIPEKSQDILAPPGPIGVSVKVVSVPLKI